MSPNFNEKQELQAFTKEHLIFDKVVREIEDKVLDISSMDGNEAEKIIIESVSKKIRRHPSFKNSSETEINNSLKEIIALLKNSGFIKPVVVQKIKKEPEFIGIDRSEINLVEIDDPEGAKMARAEIDREEIKKQRNFIFENKEVIDRLLKKSEDILEVGNPEDYVEAGLLTKEEIKKDSREVEEAKIIFEQKNDSEKKEAKKLAIILEAIIVEGVNLSKCLGDNVVARPAFPHDDIFEPKIDSYFILENIPLGVDVSMRNIKGKMFEEKVKKILRMINKDEKKPIKYFKDANGILRTRVFAPKVVISCDTTMIKELMFDFDNLDSAKFGDKLKRHRVSIEIVSQIVGGCKIFGEYAEDKGQIKEAEHYKNILSAINKIAEESSILKRLMVGAGSGAVSARIQEIVDEFKEEEALELKELQEFRASKSEAA